MRVDTHDVVAVTSCLATEADTARRLASCLTGRVRSDAALLDDALAEGLRVVGDVCGDVLEVVGLDLDLLVATSRAGARTYDAVEHDVLQAARGGAGSP